jgi:acyl-CoA reductase-like NAD-dependent aldehyde dehydrogenase
MEAFMEKYQLYIDGKFSDAETGETRPTINPANEEPIALVPVATKGDAKRAIEAAAQVVRLEGLERHGRERPGENPHARRGEAERPPG